MYSTNQIRTSTCYTYVGPNTMKPCQILLPSKLYAGQLSDAVYPY